MAAKNEFIDTTVRGSEEMFNTCCTSCSETGETKEAKKFCVDCKSYFCDTCLRDHNKFAALRSHQILDKSKQEGQELLDMKGNNSPTERCADHGNIFDKFCRDHDAICCQTCITIRHRSCKNVEPLTDVAKGIKSTSEYNNVKDSLSVICEKTRQSTAERNDNLIRLNQHKEKLLKEVEEFEQQIIKKIKEAGEATRKNILSEHEQSKKCLESEIEVVRAVNVTATNAIQKLSDVNEVVVFSNVRSCKNVIEESESVLNELCAGRTCTEIYFKQDHDLQDNMSSLKSLGTVTGSVTEKRLTEGKKAYMATLHGKFQINPSHCEITGVCVMDNGEIVIADYTNKTLKRLNRDYTVRDYVNLPAHPGDICKVGPAKVAVCLYSFNEIQFFSLANSMNVSSQFQIESGCHGISYEVRNEKVLVCNGTTRLNVYSKTGNLLRTYEKDRNDRQLFSTLRQVAFDSLEHRIYIADAGKGLIALNENGKIEWVFSAELNETWGICVLPDGAVLVCGASSNNIIQIDKQGRKVTTLVTGSEGVKRPFAMAYDKSSSRLIVGCSSNEILVYNLAVK
ncbi:E3 ubiquitin-protein ligase TRIM71-like [Mercenaria mercenaria]|uniref:E3 ubiquitin-protein ligase TRIM71-like n=1 Tax=Mercenaria mercenaria TaxID=6596 RepID=UPI00234E420D|nr:E3 ubiquitin-protein ligase TRIM71-like [Mercenaria mercenaria]